MAERKTHNTKPSAGRTLIAVAAILVALTTWLAFKDAADGRFLNWDDDRNFLQNESFRGLGLQQLAWACRTFHLGVWQPLAWMLFGVEFVAGDLSPKTYHSFSVFLHVTNAVMFYWLTLTLLRANNPTDEPRDRSMIGIISAAAAALLFAVHPLRVEAVAWISCQPYLPAAFFAMLGLTLYVRGCTRAPAANPAFASPRRQTLAAAFMCYLIAVAFKAPAVTLPLILLLVDVFPLRRVHLFRGFDLRQWAVVLIEKSPFLLVAIGAAFLAMKAKDFNESRMPFSDWSADQRLAQSAYGILFYVWKSLWPTGLAAYYELPNNLSLGVWPFNAMAGAVVIITTLVALFARRAPGLFAAWLAYLILLAPNLGIVQFSQQIAADRYAYFATMPLFVLLAAVLCRIAEGAPMPWPSTSRQKSERIDPTFVGRRRVVRWALSIAFVAALGASAIITHDGIREWRDSVSLWRASVAANPECEHSHCLLGQALAADAQGLSDDEMPRMLADAVGYLREAVRLRPDFAFAHMNLGAALLASGRPAEARASYAAALSHAAMFHFDELARLHAGFALACAFDGDMDEARHHIREADRLGLPIEQLRRLRSAIPN